MTLQEAMETGKAFRRTGMETFYDTLSEMLDTEGEDELEAIRATDYEVEGVGTLDGVTENMLIDAWNSSLPRGGSVKRAPESEFFIRFKNKLTQMTT